MKAQAVGQQVMVHQHRGAQKPHGAHHGRRVQRRLRHADGAREGVTIGLFKSPVCCAVVIKAISLQKEYKHIIYTLRSMLTLFVIILSAIVLFFLCAFITGIVKALSQTPEEQKEFLENYRMEKKQRKESKRLYRSIESQAIAKYPGRANYRKRKAYIDKHL